MLSLYLLGIPRIELNGAPVRVDTRKAIALIAYLAVKDEVQSRDGLAALLWPDLDQTRARGALRRTLSALKSQIGDRYLASTRESIELISATDLWVDVLDFRRRLQEVHSEAQKVEEQIEHLTAAVKLYRAGFMAGFTLRDAFSFDDWQFIEGETLQRELFGALALLVEAQADSGTFPEAIGTAQKWLALDPLQEDVHCHLMRLYTWAGERSAALRQYQTCLHILDSELGVAPLEETTALYQTIQDNRLEQKNPPPATTAADTTAIDTTALDTVAPKTFPLVGRAKQIQELWKLYGQIEQHGHVVVLKGETGIGKSRLAEDFIAQIVAQADAQMTVAVATRCYEGESHLAYAPIVQGIREAMKQGDLEARLQRVPEHQLAEVARLIPEIAIGRPNLPTAPSIEIPGAQSRFFEAICQLLTALFQSTAPGIIFFDDIHWIDATSLELLAFLLRRLAGKRLLILLAWRDEEVAASDRLLQIISETHRAGATTQIPLQRLNTADIEEYVHLVQPTLPATFEKRLWEESEGLPYFLVEYVSEYANALDEASPNAFALESWNIPATVRDLLLSHLARLDETARQLLQAAAVIGTAFDAEFLQAGSGRSDEEFVSGLESLLDHRLVREISGRDITVAGYDFYHDKLRVLVYEEMSSVRRRLLHKRLAATLIHQAQRRARVDSLASPIAHHLRLAGQEAEAATYYNNAAHYARSIYANDEALSQYQMAISLGHPDGTSLHVACGDLFTLSGRYADAIRSYQSAQVYQNAQMQIEDATVDPQILATVLYKLGHVYHRQGEWETAEQTFDEASALWTEEKDEDVENLVALYAEWRSCCPSASSHLYEQCSLRNNRLRLAQSPTQANNDAAALAQAYNILGILSRHQGKLNAALEYLEKSLQVAQQSHNPLLRVATLNNLALAQLEAHDTQAARLNFEAALQICQKVGDRHREAALYNNLADALHQAGEEELSMVQLKKAVTIFAELGTNAGEWQPEIWKLTEW